MSQREKTTNRADHRTALAGALHSVTTEEEMERVLVDLCTPAELRALSERWHIAKLLDANTLSYRDISTRTGASTTTIGRVARFLKEEPHQGYRTLLDREKSTK
ncbi:MAG: TrpR like protein, YerC/YecD [Robiginitomaculum sp.]|nr:MAG: TrpR like protein, YerC/YecD [Robiginitomaculum sp.]